MRHTSKKRAELIKQVKPIRDEYRAMFPKCQYPKCWRPGEEIHEISRGPARAKSLGVRAALLHLCSIHHAIVQPMPIVAQLALKKLKDLAGYCRVTVNRLRGRQDEAITEDEVDQWILKFRESCDLAARPGCVASVPLPEPKGIESEKWQRL